MPDLPASIKIAQAAIAASNKHVWPEPIPLDRRETPRFPVEALPAWLRDYVVALADETETPTEMAAMLALAVLSTAAQRRYVVQIRPKYTEQLVLWILTLLDSAERKSAVYARMLAPIYDRQDELLAVSASERARAQAALESAKGKRDKAIKDAGNAGADGVVLRCARDEAVEEYTALERALPPEPIMLVDDITPERYGMRLGDVGALTIASCEGGVLANFFGHYNGKQPKIDLLLKSHNGDDAAVDRVGRPAVTIRNPCCTLALVVQPDVLVEIATKHEWSQRGGMGRFLYALPKGNVGRRTGQGAETPQHVEDTYQRRIGELLPDSPPALKADQPATPTILRMDAQARKKWEAFAAELEPRLHPETGDLNWCSSWSGKFAGAIARIAGILQLAEHGPSDVGGEAMERALMLAPFLEGHAITAFHVAGEKPGLRDARTLLGWIKSSEAREFTERDVYRSNFNESSERAAEACRIADTYGWIRRVEVAGSRTARWESNPAISGLSGLSGSSGVQGNSQFENLSLSNGMVEPNPEMTPIHDIREQPDNPDNGVIAEKAARLAAETAHLESIAATGKIVPALPKPLDSATLILASVVSDHDAIPPDCDPFEAWEPQLPRDDEGFIGGDS